MQRALLLTALLNIGVAPSHADAQHDDALRWMDGGAGLMFDSPDGLDGPVLYVRMLHQPVRWAAIGPRFEFRDDDPGRGRAQVLSVGVEGALAPFDGLIPLHVYVPAHLALEAQHVTGNSRFRRVETGVFPRASIGIGMNFGMGRGRVRIEQRWSVSPGGNYQTIVVGLGTTAGRDDVGNAKVYLVGHELFPRTNGYTREEDFRGYSVVYQHGVGGWVNAWRGSLGVDFVVFPSYSTGVITALVGPVKELVRAGPATLQVVGQIGVTRFAEGGGVSLPVAGLVGMEGEVTVGGVGLVLSLNGFGTRGPVGLLFGLQPRFGISVGL